MLNRRFFRQLVRYQLCEIQRPAEWKNRSVVSCCSKIVLQSGRERLCHPSPLKEPYVNLPITPIFFLLNSLRECFVFHTALHVRITNVRSYNGCTKYHCGNNPGGFVYIYLKDFEGDLSDRSFSPLTHFADRI
jgi:hypothetical protein